MRKNYNVPQGTGQLNARGFLRNVLPHNSWHNISVKTPLAFCLLMLTAFISGGFSGVYAQTTVTIGTGTGSTYYAPVNRYYNYSASEQLYLGSEIGSAGVITSLAFTKLSGSDTGSIDNVTIYMKSTTATTLTNSSGTTGYTQVYNGGFPNSTTSGLQTIALTTPFTYASTAANLSILIVRPYQYYTSFAATPYYAYTATTDYKANYYYNDNVAWSSAFTQTYNRPNVQFTLAALPAACTTPDAATALTLSAVTSASVSGTITAPATAPAGYLVVRSTAATLTAAPTANVMYSAGTALGGGTVISSSASTTFTDTSVSSNTHYYYFVYAYNYDGTFTCLGPAYNPTAASADTTTCSTVPTVIGASNITSNTATLNWTSIVGAGGAAATYTVGLYTDAAYTTAAGTYTTGNLSYNLTGLTNGVTYYYRIQGATAGVCSDPTYATGSFIAQSNYTPIDVTGFNYDVIANGTGLPATSTNNDVDGGNYAYMSLDYKASATAAAATFGLPVNRILTNPATSDLKFFLQDYSVNNSLKLVAQNTAGTLTFAQPLKLSNIYLAITSGSNASTISVQTNFADGTNEITTGISILDWFGTATTAEPALVSNIGRVSRTGAGSPESGASKIFQVTVPVSAANQTKNITGITVANTTSGSSATSKIPNIFAVAGQVVGSCPVVAAVTGATASATSINISWTLSSTGGGATPTYTLEVYTDAAFTTPVTGSPFTNLTTASQAVSGLTFGTTYYYRVKAGNGTCESAFVSGSTTIEYCVPTKTGTSTSYYISNVATTGGYTNISNATATSATAGYTNYSATQIVSKPAGTSFNYTIACSIYTTIGIWVDWNNDLDFDDAGETIGTYTGSGSQTSVTGTVTIPAGTPLGNYRLRTRSVYYFNNTVVACGPLTYGEAEDYTIAVVTQPADCATPAAPVLALSGITSSAITGTVTAPATAPTGYVLIRSNSATLTAQPVSGTTYVAGTAFGGGIIAAVAPTMATFTDFLTSNTHYYYFLYAYNEGGLNCFGPIFSAAATADATTCAVATVATGASNITNNSANLNWNSVTGAGGATATYTVEVATVADFATTTGSYTTTNTSYALTGLANGTTYYFRVKAVTTGCDDETWSTASFTAQNNYTPIDVTGFNSDVIANGNGIALLSTTAAVDGASNAYMALDYRANATATAAAFGLPMNRKLTGSVAGLSLLLQDYSGNNSLRLPGQNDTGLLSFTTPAKFSELYFAVTSGSGTSTFTAQVFFDDATSQTVTGLSATNWDDAAPANSPALISAIGRVNRANTVGAPDGPGGFKLFQILVTVDAANQGKNITGIQFTKTSTGATEPVAHIFAISGKTVDTCPSLLGVAGTATSGTAANIAWSNNMAGGVATSYNIEVYTDAAHTTPVTGSPFTGVTGSSFNVTGLSPLVTYYFQVQVVNSTCTSQYYTGTFTTPCDTPATPAAAAQTFCGAATVANLAATGVAGATFSWFTAATGGTALAPATALATGTYYVSQGTGACQSARLAVAVTVNVTPVPDAPAQTICAGSTVADLGAIAANGATLNWYTTQGGDALAATDVVVTGTYYVTQTLNGCESAALAVDVTVTVTPVATAQAEQTFCNGATVADLSAEGVAGATLAWSYQGVTLEDTVVLTNGTYEVRQTAGGCTSEAVTVTVVINTIDGPTVNGQQFCGSATGAELTATVTDGAEVHWYNAAGDEVLAATSLETGTYYVSQTVNGCSSAQVSFVVTINAIPDAPAAPATQTFTDGATVASLDAGAAQGNGFAWYTRDEAGEYTLITNDTVLTNGATYYVAQTNGDCQSGFTAVTVSLTAGVGGFALNQLMVYPNPAAEYITVSNSEPLSRIVVSNLLGQTVINQAATTGTVQLNVAQLAQGTYIMQVYAGTAVKAIKFVKK